MLSYTQRRTRRQSRRIRSIVERLLCHRHPAVQVALRRLAARNRERLARLRGEGGQGAGPVSAAAARAQAQAQEQAKQQQQHQQQQDRQEGAS